MEYMLVGPGNQFVAEAKRTADIRLAKWSPGEGFQLTVTE